MVDITGDYSYTDQGDYDQYTVSPGGTINFTVYSNDVLENVLVDLTNGSTGYTMRTPASATDWTIRNFGVRGEYDNGGDTPFNVRDGSESGQSVIENVYLGDGANDSFQWNTHQVTGIYVHADHYGDLEINNCYVNEYRDNAFYGSDPGHPHFDYSGYGTVRIHDSFGRNGGFNFRISTTGSYCENCVSVITNSYNTGGPRLFYDYFSRGLEFRNCDAQGYGSHIGWGNGSTSWPQYTENGSVSLEGCEQNVGQMVGGEHPGQWTGEQPGTNPRETAPAACPTTAVEAASGDSGGSEPEPEPDPDTQPLSSETFSHTDLAGNYSGDLSHFDISSE